MTGYATTRRLAAAFVLAALVVLAAPAMAQTGSDERRGWERTSTATGQQDGQVGQGASAVGDPRPGWESTSVATGGSTSVAGDDEPISPTPGPSLSPTLMYVFGLLAAAIVAVGAARVMRPHGRPGGAA